MDNLQSKINKLSTVQKLLKIIQIISSSIVLSCLVSMLVSFIIDIIVYETDVPVAPIFNILYIVFACVIGADFHTFHTTAFKTLIGIFLSF